MQSDYRVEKNRVPVAVLTVAGERIEGDVFLQPYTQDRQGQEEVPDLLNGPEPFFPMRGRDGAIRLLAKEHIIEAELLEPPAEDDARPLGAREAMVAITLTNGRRFTACLFYQVPSARPRILDYLNGLTQRFVLVQSEESWRLVNWRHLDSIRPLD